MQAFVDPLITKAKASSSSSSGLRQEPEPHGHLDKILSSFDTRPELAPTRDGLAKLGLFEMLGVVPGGDGE